MACSGFFGITILLLATFCHLTVARDYHASEKCQEKCEELEPEGTEGNCYFRFRPHCHWDHDAFDDYGFCIRACRREEESLLPGWLALVGAIAFPIIFGIGSWASSVLLDIKRPLAITTMFLVAVSSLVATLVPPLSSREPYVCAEVRFHINWDNLGFQVFPIVALGVCGSYMGVAVACVWQCTKARTSLSWVAFVYFLMVAVFNTCGVIGICFLSCARDETVGAPLYAAWLVSSFITNLVLQKIVLMRAMLVDASKVPRCLRCIFVFEVVVAILLFAFSLGSTIRAVASTEEEDADDGEDEGTFWDIILYVTALLTFLFVVADCVFSVVSSRAMQSGLQKVKGAAPAIAQANPQLGVQESSLAQAVFFAKVNLWLVVMSVSTTSLFYFSSITLLISAAQEGLGEGHFGFLYISWLLDSLFNDVCVMFVGFGPTAKALDVVASAASADVIGAAVTLGSPTVLAATGLAPSSSGSMPVAIGVPAGVPEGRPANPSAEYTKSNSLANPSVDTASNLKI